MAQRDGRLTVMAISRVVLWLLWAWVVLDLILLLLAFVLRLFGANPDAGFTEWVYRSVERAMAPFRGIFEPIELTDRSVLDTSLLFAMIIYGIVALLLHAGLEWVTTSMARRRSRLAAEAAADAANAAAPMFTGGVAAVPPPSPSPYRTPTVVVPADPRP